MFKNTHFFLVLILLSTMLFCKGKTFSGEAEEITDQRVNSLHDSLSPYLYKGDVIISKPVDYLGLIKQKNIAIVANQTSVVPNGKSTFTHLVDSLLLLNVKVKKVFSPEHGFRGLADAGELVADGKDTRSGLPLISLYGKNKKPSNTQMQGLDLVIFDIQDVGVRFYTYLSTLHYVMEACAEAKIPLIVIDRPNPNAHYIDGPIMEMSHMGFLGKHPVPLVYGMTIGEYAQMINGEGWLDNHLKADLIIMPLKNYTHQTTYKLPIRPSPNLPNDQAINLYPSLGLFEGTSINAGRGTEMQFQIFGAPFLESQKYPYTYTPKANLGAKYPKQKDELCHGLDLRKQAPLNKIHLEWLISAYQDTPKDKEFFMATFTAHAGTLKLQQQIEKGLSAEEISKSWQADLRAFQKIRSNYLIYN